MGDQVREAERWSLNQDFQRRTELAKMATIVPHAHVCEFGTVTDVLDSQWRHLLLPEKQVFFLTYCKLFIELEVTPVCLCVPHISMKILFHMYSCFSN